MGYTPCAYEALCLYAPIARELPYAPRPYRRVAPVYTRGFSYCPALTCGGSAYICGDHLGIAPIYAGLCPIHAGKNPLVAEKKPKIVEKKFLTKGAQNLFSLIPLGETYNGC